MCLTAFYRSSPQLTGGLMGIGRPPLPVGTIGKIRLYKFPTGYRARALVRDFDGRTREVERTRPSKGAAERALKEAVRDRTHSSTGAEITQDTSVKALAEKWASSLDQQSPTTQASYRNRVLAQIIHHLGCRRPARRHRGGSRHCHPAEGSGFGTDLYNQEHRRHEDPRLAHLVRRGSPRPSSTAGRYQGRPRRRPGLSIPSAWTPGSVQH